MTTPASIAAAVKALEAIAHSPSACIQYCVARDIKPAEHGSQEYMGRVASHTLATLAAQEGPDSEAKEAAVPEDASYWKERHDFAVRACEKKMQTRDSEIDQLRRERDELRGRTEEDRRIKDKFRNRIIEAENQRDVAVRLLRRLVSGSGESRMDVMRDSGDFLATLKGSGVG